MAITFTPQTGTTMRRGEPFSFTISSDAAWQSHPYWNSGTIYLSISDGGQVGYLDFGMDELPKTVYFDPNSIEASGSYDQYLISGTVNTTKGQEDFRATYPIVDQPTITKQPSITSISPATGTSTTISWSAATVSNQGSATIYYQYFVGPSNTYSDSYHVGTTTGLSATITEGDIMSKCGSGFDGTCYLFVRAYWQDGSTTGGWTTPTGSAFTYTAHRTIGYHDGSGWVECIVYYHDGSGWVECIPHYYSGGWIECSN